MSYIIPYSLVGLSGGLALSMATNKFSFVPIFMIASIGYGMIRNTNIKNDNNQSTLSTLGSFGLKALTIYILGPSLLIIGGFTVLAISLR